MIAVLLAAAVAAAPAHVSFATRDGGLVHADVYSSGGRSVVLAHGGRFNKESWAPQAATLVKAGFRVLAFDFRGFGQSKGPGDSDLYTAPLHLDVLAAVRYLRTTGAKTVAVVGGSMGGAAAADASIEAPDPKELIVLEGSAHAQFIFRTDQGERLMKEILRFLSEP